MPDVKPRAFISYSHKDKEFARMLDASLAASNVETFLDERAILIGDSIPRKIAEGIELASCLIYVISASSVQSIWVAEELDMAKVKERESSGFKILPLLIEDIELPRYVKHLRYADFRDWRNSSAYRAAFLEVLRSLDIEPRFLVLLCHLGLPRPKVLSFSNLRLRWAAYAVSIASWRC